MKKNNCFLLLIIALIIPFFSIAQSGKTNFSGNWTVNESKNPVPGVKIGDSYLTISQNENEMIIKNPGVSGTIVKYYLDGKESNNGERKSVATWSADGKTLKIVSTEQTIIGERKTTENWYLTSPSTLVIDVIIPFQNEEKKATLIFEKK